VAAAVILFHAQFGKTDDEDDPWAVRLRFRQFEILMLPRFPAEEWYIRADEPRTWTPVNYPL